MENAQKAIMIGVGLFITIIIIAAVMLITGMGQNLLNQGQSQVEGISEGLMNELTAQYDGKKMSGSQVRTAAVQLLNRDVGIIVGINNAKGSTFSKDFKTSNIGSVAYRTIESGDSSKNYADLINAALRTKDNEKFIGSVNVSNKKITIYFE